MKRMWWVASAVTLIVGLALMLSRSVADDKKDPTVKEIMTRAHKGGDSLIQKVGKDLKAVAPDWADVLPMTKELVKLGGSLGKNTPPKGDKASWEKLTKEYVANATVLEGAAEKKDKAGALAAHKKLTGMCMTCHQVHRPKAQ